MMRVAPHLLLSFPRKRESRTTSELDSRLRGTDTVGRVSGSPRACLLARIARSRPGATAADFALVLPMLLIFLLGLIDVGRLLWTWNRASHATQLEIGKAQSRERVCKDV